MIKMTSHTLKMISHSKLLCENELEDRHSFKDNTCIIQDNAKYMPNIYNILYIYTYISHI